MSDPAEGQLNDTTGAKRRVQRPIRREAENERLDAAIGVLAPSHDEAIVHLERSR